MSTPELAYTLKDGYTTFSRHSVHRMHQRTGTPNSGLYTPWASGATGDYTYNWSLYWWMQTYLESDTSPPVCSDVVLTKESSSFVISSYNSKFLLFQSRFIIWKAILGHPRSAQNRMPALTEQTLPPHEFEKLIPYFNPLGWLSGLTHCHTVKPILSHWISLGRDVISSGVAVLTP